VPTNNFLLAELERHAELAKHLAGGSNPIASDYYPCEMLRKLSMTFFGIVYLRLFYL
jgi:hypothetical protein